MNIALLANDIESLKTTTTNWITSLLLDPNFSGADKPSSIKGYLYVNEVPMILQRGTWQITGDSIYLARTNSEVPNMTKLAIITAIASMTGILQNNTVLVERISTRLVEEIRLSTLAVHKLMLASTARPTRLAIDNIGCRVAAEMDGTWFLPGGAPVEVDSTWIIMNF